MILHCKVILGLGQPGLNEMNFLMNHAPGAGLITPPVDQQSSVLQLYHRRPPNLQIMKGNNNRNNKRIKNY